MSERLIIPVALWGESAPNHKIYSVYMMNNEKNLITGSKDGEICVWDVSYSPIFTMLPRYMIYGHTGSVTCIADGDYQNKTTFVTSSNNGEMCLWNIEDGQCIISKRTQHIHTYMQSVKNSSKGDCRLFCVGHYAEILVIEPTTFNIHYRLSSKDKPDWITSIHVIQPYHPLYNMIIIGLSIIGIVRIWTITDSTCKSLSPIYDNDAKPLNCYKSVQIISNPETLRLLLVVCRKQWHIYDVTDFLRLCTVDANPNENWTGGIFITREQVLVWSDQGRSYLYNIPTSRGDKKLPSLKGKLTSDTTDARFLYPPKMFFSSNSSGKLLIRGDSSGNITIWPANFQPAIKENIQEIRPMCFNSLEKSWIIGKNATKNLVNSESKDEPTVSVYLYLPALCKTAVARSDGSIIILTTMQFALKKLLTNSKLEEESMPSLRINNAHEGKINCLFYPNSSNSRYDRSYLLSGGADFSVCIWDLTNGSLLHKFCVHAGSITKFIATPDECSERLSNSICCIAADHSVSILNLKELKCTMVASRQLFPIVVVKWRPAEDLMVVGCVEGSAYLWKTETGLLLKVLQGSAAEETLANCDESIVIKEEQTNPAVELFKGLKQGNLSAIKNAAKNIQHLAAINSQAKVDLSTNFRSQPLIIRSLQNDSTDKDGFVMLFDIESVIEHLLHDQTLVVETFTILLSILYTWGLDDEVSQISNKSTSLIKQLDPVCIGLISKNCYMSLLLPNYVRKIGTNERRNLFFSINSSLTRLTGQCLSHLLFVPSSPNLPLYTSLRHTAVEMIGRGFTFWEPYLDVAKVLLGLLDLCSEPERAVNNEASISSKKSAKEAISLVAAARPSVFITTLAREIAKFNNKQQNSNFRTNQQQIQPILVKAKPEILRNIELLINQMPLEVADLMTEVMDITLHCLDYSLLENRGLGEAFPAITKFYMVSYCPSTRRIAVGTVSGNLALYELRAQSRPQIISAHNSGISACSFSTDGKFLASYSAGDNKLCFWLTTVSGFLGLGSSKTRCVGTIDTPPVAAELIKSPTDLLRVAKLIWFADKRVVLMLIDDRELCYQVD